MNNFEEALALIEALEEENRELKQRIYTLTQKEVNIQVSSDYGKDKMYREADAAMKRFTAKLRNKVKQYKKERNG